MAALKKLSLFVAGFLILSSAQAAVHLVLTQGINAATPIAIIPFANQSNNVPGNTTLSQVISNDLQNSGEFRVLTPGVLLQQPTQLAQIDQKYWQKQGVNDVMIGQVQQVGSNRYQVSFQLVNLYASTAANTVLLNQTFTAYQPSLRQLAHHIADMIYQKITGVRGIFSTKIAYVLKQHLDANRSRYQLVVADQDGFNPQTLLTSNQPIMSPTWTPNGRGLAYVSFEGHHAAIYLQNLATGGRDLLSRFPGMNNAPAFSPNARRLALVLTLDGNPNIFVMDLASRKLMQITKDYSIDTEPTWSADGNTLFFTSDRSGGPQIYRYDFATRQVSRVTFDGSYNARACLSPHANTLVIMHRDGGAFNIAKQNLSSGRMTMLTNSGSDDSPSLAPNGKMVLYGTHYAGREMLGLVSIDGRVKLRLPSAEGDVQDPSWSPFL
ncbi:MAG: Tol-Pal system beta propeller repeat protein TolB [Gammaproteobacteria bacterium RIFCSPHIGHO2_02_FULL_39_13]|nr:MAG: Tol-Pal system beta propeller repeat protein TolB [Gammaproteobacteria bacterium RIFCSPHIGHO2_02_FULL_39_13]OGT50546.1 MAG: Tol-Pal system beta propeller repeat protein TolB [Gammaproteobacteria bacterium RIFCSPHIGHO2_12_FULL_39_24]